MDSAIFDELNWSEAFWFANVLMIASFVPYWLFGCLFLVLDTTSGMLKYKTQPDIPLKMEKLITVLKTILKTTTVMPYCLSYTVYVVFKLRGIAMSLTPPDITTLLLHLMGCALIQEVGFYYSHRALHAPYFYKSIHKVHHELTTPFALGAIYAHPLEVIFSNMVPALLGPMLFGSSLFTVIVWNVLSVLVTTVHHSGYHLPFLPSPEFHDYHHLK
ncbi:hypothetical protein ScPMuIL_001068 [Solemya velum]